MHTLKKIMKINTWFLLNRQEQRSIRKLHRIWDEVKDQIELKGGNKPIEYKRDFMKIKFESDDDLPLGKMLNITVCLVIVRSVFQENYKYYPQFFYIKFL